LAHTGGPGNAAPGTAQAAPTSLSIGSFDGAGAGPAGLRQRFVPTPQAAADAVAAQQLVTELTLGVGADQALITAGVVTEEVIEAAFAAVRKGGTVIVTGLAGPGQKNVQIPSFELTLFQKRIVGALFGGGNPFEEIPRMIDMYRAGMLKLDELVTSQYRLDDVRQGYQDLVDGKNIRGVIVHEH
jgi:alcohol dehydrogenase (nicotinoprotein)